MHNIKSFFVCCHGTSSGNQMIADLSKNPRCSSLPSQNKDCFIKIQKKKNRKLNLSLQKHNKNNEQLNRESQLKLNIKRSNYNHVQVDNSIDSSLKDTRQASQRQFSLNSGTPKDGESRLEKKQIYKYINYNDYNQNGRLDSNKIQSSNLNNKTYDYRIESTAFHQFSNVRQRALHKNKHFIVPNVLSQDQDYKQAASDANKTLDPVSKHASTPLCQSFHPDNILESKQLKVNAQNIRQIELEQMKKSQWSHFNNQITIFNYDRMQFFEKKGDRIEILIKNKFQMDVLILQKQLECLKKQQLCLQRERQFNKQRNFKYIEDRNIEQKQLSFTLSLKEQQKQQMKKRLIN